jgi:hypothetical protein
MAKTKRACQAVTESVAAWSLAEGDRLPGGTTILLVRRNPVTREVHYLTDQRQHATVAGDTQLVVSSPADR